MKIEVHQAKYNWGHIHKNKQIVLEKNFILMQHYLMD